jgi:hypothetical protein
MEPGARGGINDRIDHWIKDWFLNPCESRIQRLWPPVRVARPGAVSCSTHDAGHQA